MLRIFSLLVAGAGALHIVEEKKSQNVSANTAVTVSVSAGSAHRKKRVVRRKISMNLANSLAHLARASVITKKQEPAAGAEEEPPAGDLPIDEEGYAADWTTEHRSDEYPPESVGKQHHPMYEEVAADLRSEVWWKWFFGSWWFVLLIAVFVAIVAAFVIKKKSSA